MQTTSPRLKHGLRWLQNIMVSIGLATTALALSTAVASAATPQEEAKALFEHFVIAQNAHDSATVESTLWNSPEFLWVSRGTQIRGTEAAMALYRTYYAATWQVEPEMQNFHAVQLSPEVVQILVPIVFTRGAEGQPAQKARYLISQSIVHDSLGWHIASILPIADTSLK